MSAENSRFSLPSTSAPLHATAEGTRRYTSRFPAATDAGHFREHQGLWLSTIGAGTYLGEPDNDTDARYVEAIRAAVLGGCNVIDSAINYRFQRSERAIGKALTDLVRHDMVKRDEVVLCTKGGYLSFDGGPPSDPRQWVKDTFVTPGLIEWNDVISWNVMTPRYIRHELEQSRLNLGVDCIDVYYLHNPEAQLERLDRNEFERRMAACFEELERAVSEGRIMCYGTATWAGYRVAPHTTDYLSLSALVSLARAVGGDDHHFRAIQLPFNLAMTEAYTFTNQKPGGETRGTGAAQVTWVSVMTAAHDMGVEVFGSASLLQGRLTQLPSDMRKQMTGLRTDAQRALQFARSAPKLATALVGMRSTPHVEENLELRSVPPIAPETWAGWFGELNR